MGLSEKIVNRVKATGLGVLATTISTLFVIMALTFNSWINSLQAINETLRTENAMIRERSTGLLKERLYRVDTLVATRIDLGAAFMLRVQYEKKVQLQGSRIQFSFFIPEIRLTDFQKHPAIGVTYYDHIDGIVYVDKPKPANESLNRSYKREFLIELGKGRYDFTAMGRKYYLHCAKLHVDPDSLTIVTTIMALDPIYKPTLGN